MLGVWREVAGVLCILPGTEHGQFVGIGRVSGIADLLADSAHPPALLLVAAGDVLSHGGADSESSRRLPAT